MIVCTLKNFLETFSVGFGLGFVAASALALTAVIAHYRWKARRG